MSYYRNPSAQSYQSISVPYNLNAATAALSTHEETPADFHHHWQLWQLHQPHFSRLCLRWMNGDQQCADEALQLATIALWSKRDLHCQQIDNPMGWLTGVVRHVCLDLQRSQQRERSRIYELDGSGDIAVESVLTDAPHQTPEAVILHREQCAYIYTEIAALPERLRQPLLLRVFHGRSYGEIAQRLHLSDANARKRVQEARERLATKLRRYQRGEPSLDCHRGTAGDWLDEATLLATTATESGAETDCDFCTAFQPRVEPLANPSKRERQKLQTLHKYVQRHPTGWKKRLELADQLCKLGYTKEAIVAYQQVVEKQPQLLTVWLQIGRLSQLVNRPAQASAAWKQALALAATPEAQDAIHKFKQELSQLDDTQNSKISQYAIGKRHMSEAQQQA